MENNVVTAVFNGSRSAKTDYLWQYDYGQILKIFGIDLPEIYEVHVSGSASGNVVTVFGNADGIVIPDEFLQKSGSITMYIYLHVGDSDGETEYKITIPVKGRFKPTHEEPTPVQQSEIEQLIASIENYDSKAEQSAEDAKGYRDEAEGFADDAERYAELAEQNADSSGYAWFEVHNDDGLMYVTTSDHLYEDTRFAVNTANGTLEVTVI